MTDDERDTIPRNTTGVPGLDAVLGGGLFVGGVYLIAGRPGAGKTLMSNQIAFEHVANGGRALYVTLLAESHARMLALMEPMSFFRSDAVGSTLQYLSGYQILEKEKLSGLSKMLRTAVRDHRATMLVVDGLLTAYELADSDVDLKKFIYEVQVLAELAGCTTLLLRGAHDAEHTYPERTMADGLLVLGTKRVGMRSVREIEIQKHRGSSHVMGCSFFEISSRGLHVHPRTETQLGLTITSPRLPGAQLVTSGIETLDPLLRGGIPAGSSTMLLGTPGIGKTLLGLQFLAAGMRAKEPVLYFGFNEPPDRIVRKARAIGLDLGSPAATELLEIQWNAPQEPLADQLAEALFENVRRRGARRVFIDGFEGFRAGLLYPERLSAFAMSFHNELRSLGVTLLVSDEVTGIFGPELVVPVGTSEVVDNILFLRHVELRSKVHRLISVMKMRDHDYESSLREFAVTDRGIVVGAEFDAAKAILTGVAHPIDPRATPRPSAKRTATTSRARNRPRRTRGK